MIATRLRRIERLVDGMTLRERMLIFASVLAAVFLGWFQLAMDPALTTARSALAGVNESRERIHTADEAVRSQAAALGVDGTSTLDAQLDQARRRALEVQALIDARAAQIVDPAKMTQVLQDMLVQQRGLRLIRAHNLTAQRVADSADDAPLYRHTLRLEVEGPYLTVLDYLQNLERLPWRIYWQGIEIDARDYPRNRVRIDVGTLSFDEDWIGV